MKTTRKEAISAVKTLLGYIEDDVEREGLLKTPNRVIDSWERFLVVMKWTLLKF